MCFSLWILTPRLESAKAADAFDEFLLLELVRGARHDVDLDAAGVGADEGSMMGVVVALVLEPQRMLLSSMSLPRRWRPLPMHQMRCELFPSNFFGPIGVKHFATSSTSCLWLVTTA